MHIRKAQVAGMFYEDRPDALRSMIHGFIHNASTPANPGNVCALILPHAGYIYSGNTAAHGYKRVMGGTPRRVIIMGVSHRHRFPGIALCEEHFYETPLGLCPIDKDFSDGLRKVAASSWSFAHDQEHTIETQIPFVQFIFGNVPIVPLLFGDCAGKTHVDFGERLAHMIDRQDLVIASTDMSHFFTEETANSIDDHTIKQVLSGNIPILIEELLDESCSMCGAAAVVAALACAQARDASVRKLLHYETSAAFSGNTQRVVGYAAFSLEYAEDAA